MYLGQVAAVKAAVQEKKGATSAKISAAAAAAAERQQIKCRCCACFLVLCAEASPLWPTEAEFRFKAARRRFRLSSV